MCLAGIDLVHGMIHEVVVVLMRVKMERVAVSVWRVLVMTRVAQAMMGKVVRLVTVVRIVGMLCGDNMRWWLVLHGL